jgi:uncharacterized SAM-binding protein YcdF (DUF218 family)
MRFIIQEMNLLKINQSRRRLVFIGLFAAAILFGLGLFLTGSNVFNSQEQWSSLMKKLSKSEPVPANLIGSSRNSNGVIYVLSGSQETLKGRCRKAASLYHEGVAGKVLIVSRKGNTEFSPSLGRNLTNDEWAAGNLISFGIKKADIEMVSIPKGFWGTYREAKAISDITLKRGYRYLILVSSPYHTRRAWNSFSKFLIGRNVSLYVYGSDDRADLNELVIEYIKLLTYDNLLLPLSTASF